MLTIWEKTTEENNKETGQMKFDERDCKIIVREVYNMKPERQSVSVQDRY